MAEDAPSPVETAGPPKLKATARRLAQPLRPAGRIAFAVGRDIVDGPLLLHASSLVYTTLLSLVPMLALAFSVLKGLGVHNQLAGLLYRALSPLGPMADDITRRVIAFVDNVHVGVLGAVGLLLLLYTSISVGRKVEQAANQIWRVARARSIGQSIASYLTVVIAGPILLFSAFALTASMMGSAFVQDLSTYKAFGWLVRLFAGMLPHVVVLTVSTLVYWLVPNTRVRLVAALIGGACAAVGWALAGWAFTRFVAGSTSYTAIYSAFAGLILLLIWLNVNWLILLAGCAVAFYVQHPAATATGPDPWLDVRLHERVALAVMREVGAAAYHGTAPPDAAALEARLAVPVDAIQAAVDRLAAAGLVVRTADQPPRLVAGRPLEVTPLKAVWDAVRAERAALEDRLGRQAAVIAGCEAAIERAVGTALAGWTLKDLALAGAGFEKRAEREDGDDDERQDHPAG